MIPAFTALGPATPLTCAQIALDGTMAVLTYALRCAAAELSIPPAIVGREHRDFVLQAQTAAKMMRIPTPGFADEQGAARAGESQLSGESAVA